MGFANNLPYNLINHSKKKLWKIIKGFLLGLGKVLAAETPSKMMKNPFYFMLKAPYFLKIFKFLFCFFVHVAKQLDMKVKVNLKFYGVTDRQPNNNNTQNTRYFNK